jgi:hypothetical protein
VAQNVENNKDPKPPRDSFSRGTNALLSQGPWRHWHEIFLTGWRRLEPAPFRNPSDQAGRSDLPSSRAGCHQPELQKLLLLHRGKGENCRAAPDPAVNFPFSYLSNSETYRKAHGAIAREIPAWNERFCSVFSHPALKNTTETRRAILRLHRI